MPSTEWLTSASGKAQESTNNIPGEGSRVSPPANFFLFRRPWTTWNWCHSIFTLSAPICYEIATVLVPVVLEFLICGCDFQRRAYSQPHRRPIVGRYVMSFFQAASIVRRRLIPLLWCSLLCIRCFFHLVLARCTISLQFRTLLSGARRFTESARESPSDLLARCRFYCVTALFSPGSHAMFTKLFPALEPTHTDDVQPLSEQHCLHMISVLVVIPMLLWCE